MKYCDLVAFGCLTIDCFKYTYFLFNCIQELFIIIGIFCKSLQN